MGECLPNLSVKFKSTVKELLVGASAKELGESDDDKRLNELGYNKASRYDFAFETHAQLHLALGFQTATNLCVIISAQSVLLSVYSSFGTGLAYGGPVVVLWGWILASIGSFCVALGMSELASAYPTSGGMYYWIYQLSGPFYGPALCWVTGWLNLLGQIASVSSTFFITAKIIGTIILLSTGTAYCCDAPPGLPPSPLPLNAMDAPPAFDSPPPYMGEIGPGRILTNKQTYGVYVGVALLTALINSLPLSFTGWVSIFGGWWHLIGVVLCIVVIPSVATIHADPSWVFKAFITDFAKETFEMPTSAYVFILGLLLPAYSFTGLDGPAHLAEETADASMAAPRAIMNGISFTIVTGWCWCLSLLFCIGPSQYLYVLGYDPVKWSETNGDVVPQVFYSAFQQGTGNGNGGAIFILIVLGACVFCSITTLLYIARILFCYSRDKAVPLSFLWIKVNPHTKTPVAAVWGVTAMSLLLGLLMLADTDGVPVAFNAILSLSTIALNVAYVAPTTARITWGRKRFVPGPWSLGRWSTLNGIIATIWVGFMVCVFSLPITYPSTAATTNWAGVMLLGVLILSLVYYFFPYYGAYKWFLGPVRETPLNESNADSNFVASGKDLTKDASKALWVESVSPSVTMEVAPRT